MSEHGWDQIPGDVGIRVGDPYYDGFKHVIRQAKAHIVFDLIELAMTFMDQKEQDNCRIRINQIFDLYECPWRIADGEFFKLDADFMGARLAANAHDALAANKFVGAADEFAKARLELASSDIRDAIHHAAKSFESVMKVMTGLEHASADQFIKAMASKGYFDDLPATARLGFADQVMKTLPFIRNKLAGHGQGAGVVNVPAAYGELAIQLAATLHNFLVTKHLERTPSKPVNSSAPAQLLDDDIPF